MSYRISLVAGIILLIVSLFILKESLAFVAHSERAIGVVIEIEKISIDDGPSYSPVFQIITKNNEEIVYRHLHSSNPPGWTIGEKATFLYAPDDPDGSVRIFTYFGLFSWTIILMAFAIPLTIVGGSYIWFERYLGTT
ncbi:DUF3592 domain-containing protein [Pedobacter caeni]|uniref:DUF3592 domain-containing protein n=1 Tax=Pedobacter caeni TaxID=288992 RepID=A0A1M4U8L0_9SPHI|nr:DUF3592 domain-containing protein [Pedobacter caeni]SHE52968.1 hypothetical protein SAMN04488522_101466 [Pedobacter caeni]